MEKIINRHKEDIQMEKKKMVVIFAVLGALFFIWGTGLAAENMQTITGTINEESQIVVNEKTVYNIGDTAKGEEMLEQVDVDSRVQVTGEVEEEDGEKIIHIIRYKLLEEKPAE